ncbi:MAG TPA: ATP-binding protein [Gemmatimonadales bacterium]|nr:ATP-binding protein [Gemmatimonadales bacterium]
MTSAILRTDVRQEQDLVLVRQRARQIARLLGLEPLDQIRIATAVSEIARNAYQYAGGGRVTFELSASPDPMLLVRIADDGPGIQRLADVLSGRFRSATGLGLGVIGARRLSDTFEIRSAVGAGTSVVLGKRLSPRTPAITPELVASLGRELAQQRLDDLGAEAREQNRELLRTLHEARERQIEVERLNQELAETNRGVLALYAELDERAQDLARASELKSRFLSNMSHELRTPLNSILNICRLLLDRLDGPLNQEQERQVRFVRNAATSLTEMVNDLLDLAKIEAGRIEVRSGPFTAGDLFGALRGMFRPLVTSDAVALVFEEVGHLPPLDTDEGKLSQILRNFIANALKFTEQGEVRVSAFQGDGMMTFAVADTGIGIAPEHQEHVFEEFSQVDSPLQRRSAGTGLGLPLARKLAELLGGQVSLRSEVGRGSVFSVTVPIRYASQRHSPPGGIPALTGDHG